MCRKALITDGEQPVIIQRKVYQPKPNTLPPLHSTTIPIPDEEPSAQIQTTLTQLEPLGNNLEIFLIEFNWPWWMWWGLGSILGSGFAHLLLTINVGLSYSNNLLMYLLITLLSGLVGGGLTGLGQSVALTIRHIRVESWLHYSIVGWLVGTGLYVVVLWLTRNISLYIYSVNLISLVTLSLPGFGIGLAQARLLTSYTNEKARQGWLILNGVGLGLAWLIISLLGWVWYGIGLVGYAAFSGYIITRLVEQGNQGLARPSTSQSQPRTNVNGIRGVIISQDLGTYPAPVSPALSIFKFIFGFIFFTISCFVWLILLCFRPSMVLGLLGKIFGFRLGTRSNTKTQNMVNVYNLQVRDSNGNITPVTVYNPNMIRVNSNDEVDVYGRWYRGSLRAYRVDIISVYDSTTGQHYPSKASITGS